MALGASTGALSGETKVLVDHEFANARVAGSEHGESNDDSEGVELERDGLELPETLRDGVTGLVLLRRRTHHARRGTEHPESGGRAHIEGVERFRGSCSRRRWSLLVG